MAATEKSLDEAFMLAVFKSETKVRVPELNALNEQIRKGELQQEQLPFVLRLLFTTHPLFVDRESRTAVRKCVESLALDDTLREATLKRLLPAIKQESGKPGIASANAFVLLEWISVLLPVVTDHQKLMEMHLPDIVDALASLLDICLGSPTGKATMRDQALRVTRRGLRNSCKKGDFTYIITTAVDRLTAKGAAPTQKNALLLGIICGVSSRIEKPKEVLEQNKAKFFAFYVREIIGSKTIVPKHISEGLHDFFVSFATEEDFNKELAPPLERALLRAPEVVLNDVITPLINSLPDTVDISKSVQEKLLKQFLSCLKSTNPAIRTGAVAAFKAAIARCKDTADISKIADEIVLPIKTGKIPAAEQRTLQSSMLLHLPELENLSASIPVALSAQATKEVNEPTATTLCSVILKFVAAGLRFGKIPEKAVLDAITKGVTDKRIGLRKTWAIRLGDVLWQAPEEIKSAAIPFAEALVPQLLSSYKETNANPLQAGQSGLATVGYVFTALLITYSSESDKLKELATKEDILKQTLIVSPKPSFLLNHRVYTKLTTEDDDIWFAHALQATAESLVSPEDPHAIPWAFGLLYIISSPTVNPIASKKIITLLTDTYLKKPELLGKILVNSLWKWLGLIDDGEKDCAPASARAGTKRLAGAINAICPTHEEEHGVVVPKEILERQLLDLAVLMHHELLVSLKKFSGDLWIATCQRCGVDPGELAARDSVKFVEAIRNLLDESRKDTFVRAAAFRTAPTLAFVAPQAITPLLIDIIVSDLDPTLMRGIGAQEALIWRSPEGEAVIDVLSSRPRVELKANAKDYEILKFEAELRAELEKKKGVKQKKLTPDEQARVNAQIQKESEIRKNVNSVYLQIERGVGLVHALATGVNTPLEIWLRPAIKALLSVLEAGAGILVGQKGVDAYLACSAHISTRLGALRPILGVATLRSLAVSSIPENYLEEGLGALVTRLLYRLRFLGEQRPLDAISLVYIIPFIITILDKGGVGGQNAEENDEQVVLAIEFIAFHTETCSDQILPRKDILHMVIQSMQRYSAHYKIIKDCLTDLCRCIAPTIDAEETATVVAAAIAPEVSVRTAVLQAIDAELNLDLEFSEEIWIAYHDEVDENSELAQSIWIENSLEVQPDSAERMIPHMKDKDRQIRVASAKALAEAVEKFPENFEKLISLLEALYQEKAKPIVPVFDKYGIQKKTDLRDPWEARSGVALTLLYFAPFYKADKLVDLATFLIEGGALADRSPTVRNQFIEAATAIISAHGHKKLEELMKVFENCLEAPDEGSEVRDRINEAVIILYGALGRHLKSGDPRVSAVIRRLMATLSVPSESVQYAVAECLPPLIKTSRDQAENYIKEILEQLFVGKFAARRGAAYGLAGIIKGTGIGALAQYDIIGTLKEAAENKKEPTKRQSALFAFELLSLILGKLFEPYVIQNVPLLLSLFGDPSIDVREACSDTAKVCFSQLTAYGVKLILPNLLEALDEDQWRTKKGACEMLGSMAYLAPHQLAISLPEIIPPLTTVLNDSHKEVRAAGNRALKKFGEVVTNPEVKSLVGILLKALSDPTKYTNDALEALLKVQFVHYLDAPSLALVVKILERALGERSASKRMASQIIGSLAHLTERKDILVHIPVMVAGLKTAIVDPVPATRATASKALGTLVEKLGEDSLPDIIPGLMNTLKSDTGAGDRLGSAQALSEVLASLGTQRLEETLPTILQNAKSSKAAIREGFMSLFIYLPVCFGNSFSAYLSRIIPPILSGLADDVDSIREVSLKAGRLLVKNFATRAIDLLLPELERGLADANYRIRLSSVELVGDLLFNLTGITGKADEDDFETSKEVSGTLLQILGVERRDKILSSLYICRCDTAGQVRLAAVTVWKALVASPKTLKDLVPTLTSIIIKRLASPDTEQREIAGNALGELIRKAGESVLASLLPTLEEGLKTATDSDSKQGICIALREVVESTSPETIEDYDKTIVSVVRTALVDSDEEVRETAAAAFDALQSIVGKRAVDQVLPYLLSLLRSEDTAENALAGLLTLLTEETRASIILPNLLPTLLASPISLFNARALGSLAEVAGSSLNRRLPNIINAIMDNIIVAKEEELKEELESALEKVLLSVDEYDGMNSAMNVVLTLAKHDDHRKRAKICKLMARFFEQTELDYSRYTQDFIRVFLHLFDDRDSEVVKNAWAALNELTKQTSKEEMETLVAPTKTILQQVGVKGRDLPGFALPKGINAILPIFLQGLLYGTSEQRTQSALAILEIIDRTSGESLRPFVTQITGPLIRVVSERSVEVKAAILLTLDALLQKIPLYLKPFLPQLQRTFAKSLADGSSELLRTRAAKALGTLITLTPRIDPLVTELVAGAKTSDEGVKSAMLKALYEVVSKAVKNMGESSKSSILSLIENDIDENDDAMAISAAKLLGALVKYMLNGSDSRLIQQRILTIHFTQMSILSLNAALVEVGEPFLSEFHDEILSTIIAGINSRSPFISENAVLAAGKYLLTPPFPKAFEQSKQLFETLASAIKAPVSASTDTKRLALVVLRVVTSAHYTEVKPHIALLAPVVFSCVRDIVIPVKLSAEQAFLALFRVVEHSDKEFEKYISTVPDPMLKRSMGDYFKRVVLKLAAAERERIDAGGANAGLDEGEEDLKEVWCVGKVDIGTF